MARPSIAREQPIEVTRRLPTSHPWINSVRSRVSHYSAVYGPCNTHEIRVLVHESAVVLPLGNSRLFVVLARGSRVRHP